MDIQPETPSARTVTYRHVSDRDDVSGADPPTQPDPPTAPPASTQPDQPDTPAQPRPAADTSQPQQTETSGSRPTPHSPNPPPASGPDPWPPIPTVEHIRTDNLQRTQRTAPSRGARRLLYRATRGKINPGLSTQEKYRDDLHRRARTLLRGNYRIGVVGKGGAGKTTIAVGVGSMLAQLRDEDRVVAVDADTGFGKLGLRVDPRAVSSYYELVTDPNLDTFSDIRSCVGENSAGLFVLPGDPQRRYRLTPALYHDTVARLDRFFAVTIVDCGATMDTPVTRAIARDLDAAIVVTTPWADAISVAQRSVQWLAENGTGDLMSRTILILNNSDGNADRKTAAQRDAADAWRDPLAPPAAADEHAAQAVSDLRTPSVAAGEPCVASDWRAALDAWYVVRREIIDAAADLYAATQREQRAGLRRIREATMNTGPRIRNALLAQLDSGDTGLDA